MLLSEEATEGTRPSEDRKMAPVPALQWLTMQEGGCAVVGLSEWSSWELIPALSHVATHQSLARDFCCLPHLPQLRTHLMVTVLLALALQMLCCHSCTL